MVVMVKLKLLLTHQHAGSNAVTITPATFNGGSTINIDAPGEVLFVCLKN